MTINYYKLPLRQRLQETLSTLTHCSIRRANNKKERLIKDQMMIDKLIEIHGQPPEGGDWKAWSVCSCCARVPGSKDYCVEPNHWFLYNNDDDNEKQQLRQLRKDLIIRDLPTGHKRYLTNVKNGTHNFSQKHTCPGCKKEYTGQNIGRHMDVCKALKARKEAVKKHEDIIKTLNHSNDNQEVIQKLLTKTIHTFVEKTVDDKSEIKSIIESYYKAINLSLQKDKEQTSKTINNLQSELSLSKSHNEKLIERIKHLEEAFHKMNQIFTDNVDVKA